MIQSFITSFKLKNTYRVNTIIYSIKQLPIIKNILPNSLYSNKKLKLFGNIVSSIIELGSVFIGKLLYLLVMILALIQMYKTNSTDTFLHIFVFLTIIGGFLNTFMFNPTKDKYYAMVLMNMDAKKYTLSNYYYSIIKVIIGFLPFTIIFGLSIGLSIYICLLLPIFVVMVKMIFNYCYLYNFKNKGKATNENLPPKVVWFSVAILLACAYGLPFLNIVINQYIFIGIFSISLIMGIFSFIKINKFNEYKKMYKDILTESNVQLINNSKDIIKENITKQIEIDENITVIHKSGFAYFHDLFVKRHRKILKKSANKQSIIILFIFIGIICLILFDSDISGQINKFLLMLLPYFVFIMYILNRGPVYTQAMFFNCDHSMLTYRFFRTPKVILGLFKERLKTLIKINLLPTLIIAISLPVLLLLTGGSDNPWNYVILFVSIIAMSIFFSVHYLVMYYLLQPYNASTEMKSSAYSLVQGLTYFVCYYMIGIKLPTQYFGIAMIIFCIAYIVIALLLVYKRAEKTFKLRV